jgi:uncharacterized protein
MQFPENVTRLCPGKRFSFGCHPGISCFTECCRELELALTPYDVLCLCKELKVNASDFIDRYVVLERNEKGGFPSLYLGMVDDGRASCPFISESGCSVYNSRPGACRAYPVGRGVTLDAEGRMHEIYILVHENHCLGFAESTTHSAAEWFENQGLNAYNRINDEVLGLLQHEQIQAVIPFTVEQIDTFMLGLYKLDEFRSLVSSPAFQNKYRLDPAEYKTVLGDDLKLLRFGIRWLKEHLLSEKL